MVGWHHQLNGHESEQALRDGEGQGRLVCCSPWGHKASDTTEQLNNSSSCELVYRMSPSLECEVLGSRDFICALYCGSPT